MCCILNGWRDQIKCRFSNLECGLFINELCVHVSNLFVKCSVIQMIGARWAVADPRIPQAGERQTGHADQAGRDLPEICLPLPPECWTQIQASLAPSP